MILQIGEIVKAQGIKGEVKVKPLVSDPSVFRSLRTVSLEHRAYKPLSVTLRGGFAYIRFDGVCDRNAAELLVGGKLTVHKSELPPLNDGEYYRTDIIGCTVALKNGTVLGRVSDIANFGAADVYTVVGERTLRFPFLNKLIISIDTSAKLIILDTVVFDEVCVYED